MEGYLELRHNKWLKSNKKYYFLLTPTRMVYFDSQEACSSNPTAPEGFFNLREVLSVELSQKHKQCIEINTTTQTLVLKAKEDSVLWRWMGSIKENAAKLKIKETETKSTKSPSTRSRRKGSLQPGSRRKLQLSRSFTTADQDVNKALKKIRKEAVEGRKPFGPLRPGMREARSEEDLQGGIINPEREEERRKRESGNSVVSRESLGSITRVLSLPPVERVKRRSGSSMPSREDSVSGSSNNLKGTRSPRIPITSAIAKSMIVNNESHMRDSLDYEVSEDFDNLKADTSAELRGDFDNFKADTSEALREDFDTTKADTSTESPEPEELFIEETGHGSQSNTDTLEIEYAQNLARFNDNNQGSAKFVTRDDEELEIKPKRRNSIQPILKGLGWLTIRRSKKKGKDSPKSECSRNNSIDSMERLDSPETPEKNVNFLENDIDKVSGTSKDDVRSETEQVPENSEVANKENNEKHFQPNIGESKFKHHRGSVEIINKEKNCEEGRRSRTGSISSSVRTRTFSETSAQSDDITDGSVTENVKSKVSKWKQKSIRRKSEKAHKSPSKYSISGPIPVVYQKQNSEERRRILAEIDAQCSVEFSEKDIQDILNYPLAEHSNNRKNQKEDKPPEVPVKPVKFQIRQLEQIQAGNINPRPDMDEMEVMLKLESLKVVANLDDAIHENGKQENIYDTPRPLNVMTNHDVSRISMQSDSDISVPETNINTFRPRMTSISSRRSTISAGSYESTVVLRQKL